MWVAKPFLTGRGRRTISGETVAKPLVACVILRAKVAVIAAEAVGHIPTVSGFLIAEIRCAGVTVGAVCVNGNANRALAVRVEHAGVGAVARALWL